MTTAPGTLARMTWGAPTAPTTPTAPTAPTLPTSYVFAGLQDGMTKEDLGNGTYNILYNGQSLGTGYKDVQSAVSEIGFNNASKQSYEQDGQWFNPLFSVARQTWQDSSGNEVTQLDNGEGGTLRPDDVFNTSILGGQYEYNGERYTPTTKTDNTPYNSQAELDAALKGYTSYRSQGGGAIGDWETLGQVLNGAIKPEVKREGYMTNSGAAEHIKGTNTLYGSTPVFSKGDDGSYSLLGYRTDLTPGQNYDGGDTQWNEFSVTAKHNGRKSAWQSNVWRELADQAWWQNNTVVGEGGNTFIPLEKAGEASGWYNKDAYGYQSIDKGGLFGTIFDALDPILDKTMPFHNRMQDDVTKILGKDSQKETFNIVAPIVLSLVSAGLTAGAGEAIAAGGALTTSQVVGYGLAAANAANAASNGNWLAALTTVLGAGVSSGAFNAALDTIGAGASEMAASLGISQEAQNAASAAIKGFVKGDLNAMTSGAIKLEGAANMVVGTAVRNAVKNAALAGITGAELEDVMKTAIISGISSLVGGTVGAATGSNEAGAAAGALTGVGIKNATRPDAQPAQTTTTPAATSTTSTGSSYAPGRLARMTWSST